MLASERYLIWRDSQSARVYSSQGRSKSVVFLKKKKSSMGMQDIVVKWQIYCEDKGMLCNILKVSLDSITYKELGSVCLGAHRCCLRPSPVYCHHCVTRADETGSSVGIRSMEEGSLCLSALSWLCTCVYTCCYFPVYAGACHTFQQERTEQQSQGGRD